MGLGKVIAGLGAAAGGYARGRQQYDDAQMRLRQDQRVQDQHDLAMQEAQRTERNRISLANAAAPAEVKENAATLDMGAGPKVYDDAGVAGSDARQASRMGLASTVQPTIAVNGTGYGSRAEADAAAAAYNSPEATDKRITLAMARTGDVTAAKRYEGAATQQRSAVQDLADKTWRRQLGDALRRGHEGIAEMVTKSQGAGLSDYQLQATPVDGGKNVVYAKVNADGTTTPLPNLKFSNDEEGAIRAAYMLDRTVSPEQRYTHMLSEEKGRAAQNAKLQELELKRRQLEEVAIPTAEARAALMEVRGQIAQLRGAGASDKVGREERLRYTTLFSDAGRRMQDSQKAIAALQRDPVFMVNARKPNSPEAQQLQGLQDELASHRQERELYQGLLAGQAPQGGGGSGAGGAARPAAKGGEPITVSSAAERDKLPKGTRYKAPDGAIYIKQ